MLTISVASFAQMSGTYKVGTGETTPNFATLNEAVNSLNTNGLNGDVVLEITSDITEAANVGLGVNTNSYKITIRPDADVLPFIITDHSQPEIKHSIARTENGIFIELGKRSDVEIYNISGKLIEKVKTEGTYTRDLDNGIYIIRIDGVSTKFIK